MAETRPAGLPNEQVILRLHPSRIINTRHYLASALLVALAAVILFLPQYVPFSGVPQGLFVPAILVPVLLAAALVAVSEYAVRIRMYTITNLRVIERKGVFSVNEVYVMWDRIADCDLDESLVDRFLNVGSVYIQGSGQGAEINIEKVRDIRKVKEVIDGMVTKKD